MPQGQLFIGGYQIFIDACLSNVSAQQKAFEVLVLLSTRGIFLQIFLIPGATSMKPVDCLPGIGQVLC